MPCKWVAVGQQLRCHWSPTFHIGVRGFLWKVQLPADRHPGGQQVKAQVCEPLLPAWENQ